MYACVALSVRSKSLGNLHHVLFFELVVGFFVARFQTKQSRSVGTPTDVADESTLWLEIISEH